MGTGRHHRARGFALVVVLWSMAALALLGARLTATAREQTHLATAARDVAVAEAAADGAIRQAMFALCDKGRATPPTETRRIRVGEAIVTVTTEDESGKINPNVASAGILRDLLMAIGVDHPRAAVLAGEIVDWRNRNRVSVLGGPKADPYRARGLPYRSADRPFDSIDEIGLVADMTREIAARLRPWLSVHHEGGGRKGGGGDMDAASPAAAVIADARFAGRFTQNPGFVGDGPIARVTAAAVVPGRARFVRSAVVRVGREPGGEGRLFQVLTWE